jgi:polyhydroxyalkanoate synthesis regulator phasin
MQDAWRAYLEVALGLTEASKKRAQKVARKLVGQGGVTASQLQGLAEELRSTGLANREALTKIVRFEVERALGVVGLATADEVASLTARVRELEQDLREARRTASAGPAPTRATGADAEPAAAGKALAKLAPEKKSVAKKPVAKKTTAAAGPAKKAAATAPEPEQASAAGVAAPAKKATKAAPAKKVAVKKLPPAAKKTAAKKPPPAAGTGTA